MSERGKKDQTPPPLLLMPASGGLTLNASAPNVLMPVVQAEASLFEPGKMSKEKASTSLKPVTCRK